MTVVNAIAKYPGKYIKVGFGNAFVYCDMINESTKEEIKDQESIYLDLIKKKVEKYESNKEYTLNQIKELKGLMKKLPEEKHYPYGKKATENFMKAYPELYRKGEGSCREIISKMSKEEYDKMMNTLEAFKKKESWNLKKYAKVPYASTFLEKELWSEERLERRLEFVEEELRKWKKTAIDFKPFLRRQCKDIRKAIAPNTIIIIGEGDIYGPFWDVEEYRYWKENGRYMVK